MVRAFGYFDNAFSQKKLVEEATQALEGVDFDTFVGRGISGAVAVPVLAYAMGKSFALVRKPKGDYEGRERSHSDNAVEGIVGTRWIFVDDFVSSGHTRKATREAIEKFCSSSVLIGTYEYQTSSWSPKIL